MTIQHQDSPTKGVHFITNDSGARIAEMTYSRAGETRISIDHTFVDESLRGQGIGRQLLDATADFARKANLKVLATCPYAKAELDKHRDEFADVLA